MARIWRSVKRAYDAPREGFAALVGRKPNRKMPILRAMSRTAAGLVTLSYTWGYDTTWHRLASRMGLAHHTICDQVIWLTKHNYIDAVGTKIITLTDRGVFTARTRMILRRFGSLTVLGKCDVVYHSRTYRTYIMWCLCDCGQLVEVDTANLYRSHTRSCGCISRERAVKKYQKHGQAGNHRTSEYSAWIDMRRRARILGISIDPILDDYESFQHLLGERPKGYILSRLDPDKGLEPNNIAWMSRTEARERRVGGICGKT